ncbi:hypothetical protein BpHYR1_017709 [Brachionus plicatilis]|uniref:Uncharacterized protein n=1 Tax=Brachionus plicatilis TaxID=10195 RepID=A0A3M7PRR8_BRAPC|nr:hypothetical protein BpHYR1_017709 [Brachionus plicatilis]
MNIPNKSVFVNHKAKYNNRETLALKSIDLASSQEIKLKKFNSNFEKITQENKASVNELPKKYLTTIQLNFNLDNKLNNQTNFEALKFRTKSKKSKIEQKASEIVDENKFLPNNLKEEPEVIMVDENKFRYKDIEIDFKSNQISSKKSELKEVSDDKISILSATESLNSLDENSRIFVENFFDRKLSSNSSKNHKESNEYDSRKIEDIQVQESKNNFLEDLFNYIPKREDLNQNKPQTFLEKLNFLENFQQKNPVLGKIIKNYTSSNRIMTNPKASMFIQKRNLLNCNCIQNGLLCCLSELEKDGDMNLMEKCCNKCTAFELSEPSHLNDESFYEIVEASNLLNSNEFRRFFRKFKNKNLNCWCFTCSNNFSCCINAIYESLEINDFKKLDPTFKKNSCCSRCVKPDEENGEKSEEISENKEDPIASVRSSIDELLETSEIDRNRIDIARKSIQKSFELFFRSENNSGEEKLSNFGVQEPTNSKSPLEKVNYEVKPIESQTPRKSIIKSKPKFFQKSNDKKKSVTFEDPKRGFMRVEIPDWLEHLRDPVYSKQFNKCREEWKN